MNLLSTFPNFINSELLKRRQDRLYLQEPRSVWMRMTSNFLPEGGERRVLMGGDLDLNERIKFGFEGLYENETDTGEPFRPAPTITGVSSQEQLESYEVTVNWKAGSLQQVEDLFPYFMNPGRTVVVDWGFSDAPPEAVIDVSDEQALIEQYAPLNSVRSRSSTDTVGGKKPLWKSRYDHPRYKVLERGEGKYTFITGIIQNFSFSPDGEGGYDCTTEVTHIANAMVNLSIRNQQKNRSQPTEAETDDDKTNTEEEKEKPILFDYMNRYYYRDLQFVSGTSDEVVKVGNVNVTIENSEGERQDDSGVYYVSWGYVEDLVNRYSALENSKTRTITMNSADSIISSFRGLRSLDPSVVIFNARGVSGSLRKIEQPPPQSSISRSDFNQTYGSEGKSGFLYNLYFEAGLVYEAFQTNDTIQKALKYVLDRATNACFQIWDWKLVSDSNLYRFVDMNASSGATVTEYLSLFDSVNEDEIFVFKPNTTDTILRAFSLTTKMDGILKGQLVASQNANLDGKGKNAAHNDRNDSTAKFFSTSIPGKDVILDNLKRDSGATEQPTAQSESPSPFNRLKPLQLSRVEPDGGWFWFDRDLSAEEYRDELRAGRIDVGNGQDVSAFVFQKGDPVQEAQRISEALQADSSERSAHNANNVINFDTSLEIEGLGGVCAYQVFQITNIPELFNNSGVFMIDSVSHSVSPTDWTTSIDAVFVVRNLLNQRSGGLL